MSIGWQCCLAVVVYDSYNIYAYIKLHFARRLTTLLVHSRCFCLLSSFLCLAFSPFFFFLLGLIACSSWSVDPLCACAGCLGRWLGCSPSLQWVDNSSTAMQLLVFPCLAWLLPGWPGILVFQFADRCRMSLCFLSRENDHFMMLFINVLSLDLEEIISSVHILLIQRL